MKINISINTNKITAVLATVVLILIVSYMY